MSCPTVFIAVMVASALVVPVCFSDPIFETFSENTVTPFAGLPPVAEAGDHQCVDWFDVVTLDGSGSYDPEGDELLFHWAQVSGREVTLNDADKMNATFNARGIEVSSLNFTLTLTEKISGASDTDWVIVTIFENLDQAVFVAPFGDDSNPGTMLEPYRTIMKVVLGLGPAPPWPDIYLHQGEYWPWFAYLLNGMSLYGGFTQFPPDPVTPGPWPEKEGWWRIDHHRGDTKILAKPPALFVIGISSPTTINGLTIEAYDGKDGSLADIAGHHSTAIYVEDSDESLIISNNTIIAGKGGDGSYAGIDGREAANGQGGFYYYPGRDWIYSNGTETSSPVPGGLGGIGGYIGDDFGNGNGLGSDGGWGAGNTIESRKGSGGEGGDIEMNIDDSTWAKLGATLALCLTGGGLLACIANILIIVANGVDIFGLEGDFGYKGMDGEDGDGGKGGTRDGTLDPWGEWHPHSGEAGTNGTHGTGGGGGGGGGGAFEFSIGLFELPSDWVDWDKGGRGGGGGAGGEGGKRGTEGGGAGGSFGIYLNSATPIIFDNNIQTKEGGNGGRGGNGSKRGLGGFWGLGSWGEEDAGDGGHGAYGGHGGAGGGGGGGAGGPSCGIFYALPGVAPNGLYNMGKLFAMTKNDFTIGPYGFGGMGGKGGIEPWRQSMFNISNDGEWGENGFRGKICPHGDEPSVPFLTWESGGPLFPSNPRNTSWYIWPFDPGIIPDMGIFGTSFDSGDVLTRLISPSGIEYSRYNPFSPEVSHMLGDNYELILISPLESGLWTIKLHAVEAPPEGINFSVKFYGVPKDRIPVADSGPDRIIECDCYQGALVQLNGQRSSDSDGDPLVFSWIDVAGNVVISNVTYNPILPLGNHTFTLVADDKYGGISSDNISVTVQDTLPPVITFPVDPLIVNYSTEEGAQVDLSSIVSAFDVCSPTVTITNDAPSLFHAGTTAVTFNATDESGNSAHAFLLVEAHYIFDGLLPPIKADKPKEYKSGRTIPVKFEISAEDGSTITNAIATLKVFKLTGNSTELIPFGAAGFSNIANVFRHTEDGHYIYNLKTKGFSAGTYLLEVELNDYASYVIEISVRD